MGKLHYGIHRGTLMSRDVGDILDIVSEDAARKKAIELEEGYKKMGYMLWFAHYKDTPESEFVEVHEGHSYS